MTRAFCTAAIAAAALVVVAAAPAAAKSKKSAGAQPNAVQIKCLQQAGASIDPVTKKWTIYMTERDGMSRLDMFRSCLAGGDRSKARNIRVPERVPNAGNG